MKRRVGDGIRQRLPVLLRRRLDHAHDVIRPLQEPHLTSRRTPPYAGKLDDDPSQQNRYNDRGNDGQGKTPRNFEIDPSGSFLLVANQDTNNIVTFWINPDSGRLIPTDQTLRVPSPVCLKFMAAN